MVETRNLTKVSRPPAKQLEYDARKGRERKERNDTTRRNAVGGVIYRKRKRGGRGAKLKKGKGKGKGKGENASGKTEGGGVHLLPSIKLIHLLPSVKMPKLTPISTSEFVDFGAGVRRLPL
jgi:hypothetical protein